MFCTACGTRNIETSNFCKQCGHKLDRAAAPKISEEAFDRALPLEEQVTALMERAYRLRKAGELSAAVRLCEEALHLNPGSTSVHSLLGQIHEQMGNHDAAVHEYERVLQLNPGSIADRVKLDELRGDGLPAPLHPRSAPHIVMPNHPLPNPNGRQMLGIAGIAGVLMLLGGLLALQYRAHQDSKTNTQVAGGSGRTTGINANGAATDPRASTGGAGGNTEVASSGVPGTTVSSPAGLPNNVIMTPYVGYPPPQNSQTPVYVQGPTRTVYVPQPSSSPSVSNRNGNRLPNLSGAPAPSAEDSGDDRVILTDSGEKKYVIPIQPDGTPNSKSADNAGKGGTSPKTNTAGGPKGTITPNPPPVIKVYPNGNGGGNGDGNVASSPLISTEAQSQLAIASDKFKQNNYEGAIANYRHALPGAGNQTAYVYQQMGICFQRIKNKASAINNFNNAIAEYQKLEKANQQVDLARVGIRVCENGIKLCNAE